MPKPLRRVTDPNLIAVGHLVRLLQDNRTRDNRQLAEETGLTYLTVCRYTAVLHQTGAAHVSAWKPDSRGAQTIRVFAIGDMPDAKPVLETHAQKQRRLRRKWKAQRTRSGVAFTTD